MYAICISFIWSVHIVVTTCVTLVVTIALFVFKLFKVFNENAVEPANKQK